jgi:hypothetical protein
MGGFGVTAACLVMSIVPPNVPGTVRSRLKHFAGRAEVCTDRRGARVCLRLPLAAG